MKKILCVAATLLLLSAYEFFAIPAVPRQAPPSQLLGPPTAVPENIRSFRTEELRINDIIVRGTKILVDEVNKQYACRLPHVRIITTGTAPGKKIVDFGIDGNCVVFVRDKTEFARDGTRLAETTPEQLKAAIQLASANLRRRQAIFQLASANVTPAVTMPFSIVIPGDMISHTIMYGCGGAWDWLTTKGDGMDYARRPLANSVQMFYPTGPHCGQSSSTGWYNDYCGPNSTNGGPSSTVWNGGTAGFHWLQGRYYVHQLESSVQMWPNGVYSCAASLIGDFPNQNDIPGCTLSGWTNECVVDEGE